MTPATCIKFSLIFLLIFGNPFLYGIISYYAIINQPSTLGALSKMPGYVPYSTGPAQGLAGGLGAAFFTISLIFAVCLCDEISSGRFANFLCFFSIPNHLPMPILFAAAVYGIVFWNNPDLVYSGSITELLPQMGRTLINEPMPVRSFKFWKIANCTIDPTTFRNTSTYDRIPVYVKYSFGSDGQFHEVQYEGSCTPCSTFMCPTERCARAGDAYYVNTLYIARIIGPASPVSLWILAQVLFKAFSHNDRKVARRSQRLGGLCHCTVLCLYLPCFSLSSFRVRFDFR